MNNDLISREALKKSLNYIYDCAYIDSKSKEGIASDIIATIDNAPTVEPCYQTTSCLDCGNYDKENHNCPRYCEVIKEAINSRPQGEWIDTMYGFHTCSICGKYGNPKFFNFCPNCGAKMKGGAE